MWKKFVYNRYTHAEEDENKIEQKRQRKGTSPQYKEKASSIFYSDSFFVKWDVIKMDKWEFILAKESVQQLASWMQELLGQTISTGVRKNLTTNTKRLQPLHPGYITEWIGKRLTRTASDFFNSIKNNENENPC